MLKVATFLYQEMMDTYVLICSSVHDLILDELIEYTYGCNEHIFVQNSLQLEHDHSTLRHS